MKSTYSVSTTLGRCALLAASLAIATTVAKAQTLTFQGLQNNEAIENYYDGGYGSDGSGPGPNYGITFSSDSLALISHADGGTGNFNSTPGGDTEAYFLSGGSATMNVAAGFNTGFSFYFNAIDAGSVTVWSGLNGTGTELADIPLAVTYNGGFVWDTAGVTFSGTAESVEFGGAANEIGFDNITLGSSTPGTVPDAGGLSIELLAGLALSGAIFAAKRRASVC